MLVRTMIRSLRIEMELPCMPVLLAERSAMFSYLGTWSVRLNVIWIPNFVEVPLLMNGLYLCCRV